MSQEITTHFDLRDPELFEIANRAAAEHEAKWDHAWHPGQEHFASFIRRDGKVIAFAIWQGWEGGAFIGTAWTAPEFRRQGLYRRIIEEIREEALNLGLDTIGACVDGRNLESIEAHKRIIGQAGKIQFEMPIGR